MKAAFRGHRWIGCAGHQLNTVLSHVFKGTDATPPTAPEEILTMVTACQKLVTLAKKSSLGGKLKSTLKKYVETRWDSRVTMMMSVAENLDDIKRISLTDPKLAEILSVINPHRLQEVIEILKPFKEEREILCAEKTPTIHLVLISRQVLRDHLDVVAHEDQTIKDLKSVLRKDLDKTLVVSNIHLAASMITPEYRSVSMASNEEAAAARTCLQGLLQEMDLQSPEVSSSPSSGISSSLSQSNPEDNPVVAKRRRYADKPTSVVDDEDELEKYFKFERTQQHMNMCPIEFWVAKAIDFPRLSKVALEILSIPATSCSSERSFNIAGLVLTDRRSSLTSKHLNNSIFIKSNKEFAL